MSLTKLANAVLWASLALAPACSRADQEPAGAATSQADGASAPAADLDTTLRTVEYAWDPKDGDPAVPAEEGGPGFTGEGWITNMSFPELGEQGVPQGGELVTSRPDWPATLRMTGKDWNQDITYRLRDLCYESLLMQHPVTGDLIPRVATHWWISEDGMTFRFRINPRARFSNGEPLVAADVVASFRLRMDPTTLDPSSIQTFSKLEEPVALSKYIVEVTCKERNWRNLLYFSGAAMTIFPASQVAIPGSQYLDEYQFKFVANSGPYGVRDEDIKMGQSITARLRDDWWDRDNPAWEGLYNIGAIKFVVVMDTNLEFEKFKKGEIDVYEIPKASWYAVDVPALDAYQRGLIRRIKVYSDFPKGSGGIAINTRRAPLDDLRVRQALAHLLDRKMLLAKFMYDEYVPLNSYWPGGPYANPDNVPIEYDPFRAVELLEAAGWTEKDSAGYRVKDGRVLAFDLTYASQLMERYLTIYQEDCKKAGVRLDLQLLTQAARWKIMREKEFDLTWTSWGAIDPPNPESSFHGRLAAQSDNNNVTSFADPRVDELCSAYDREEDPRRRIEIVREIDGILHAAQPYVQDWNKPAERFVIWNKFGIPRWGGSRLWDKDQLTLSWWVDPEKERALAAARADASLKLERGIEDYRFWEVWNARQEATESQ